MTGRLSPPQLWSLLSSSLDICSFRIGLREDENSQVDVAGNARNLPDGVNFAGDAVFGRTLGVDHGCVVWGWSYSRSEARSITVVEGRGAVEVVEGVDGGLCLS